jgi:hypothetical protein
MENACLIFGRVSVFVAEAKVQQQQQQQGGGE